MPERMWNVYRRPPSVIFGSAVARSGTTCEPAPPPARRNVIRPSFVASRISHPSVVAESAPSRWSGFDGIPASSVPPFTGVPPPEAPPEELEPPPQPPAAARAHTAAGTARARSENVLIRRTRVYTRAGVLATPGRGRLADRVDTVVGGAVERVDAQPLGLREQLLGPACALARVGGPDRQMCESRPERAVALEEDLAALELGDRRQRPTFSNDQAAACRTCDGALSSRRRSSSTDAPVGRRPPE